MSALKFSYLYGAFLYDCLALIVDQSALGKCKILVSWVAREEIH